MAAIADSSILRFASKPIIIEYLQSHPTTREAEPPFTTSPKIIEAAAHAFANTTKSYDEVEKITRQILHGLNLELPDCVLITIVLNLEDALIDCANRKEILFFKIS